LFSDLKAYWLITKRAQGQGDDMKVPSRGYGQHKENKKKRVAVSVMKGNVKSK